MNIRINSKRYVENFLWKNKYIVDERIVIKVKVANQRWLKFIATVQLGQELIGFVKIQKKTKSLIFLTCELKANEKIVATASGIWKILNP